MSKLGQKSFLVWKLDGREEKYRSKQNCELIKSWERGRRKGQEGRSGKELKCCKQELQKNNLQFVLSWHNQHF